MNITMMRLKPVAKELNGIRKVLERIAECMEYELSLQGYNIRVPKVDTSGPEPTIGYTDEAEDFIKETNEFLQREEQRAIREEEERESLNVFKQNNP